MSSTAEYVDEGPASSNLATYRYARYLIANLPTFQQVILGVSSASEAMLKIYKQETLAESNPDLAAEIEGDENPEMQPRPFCILTDSSRQRRKIAYDLFAAEGVLVACFECLVPVEFKLDRENDGVDLMTTKFQRRVDWRLHIAGALEDEICGNDQITGLSGRHDPDGNPFLNVVNVDQIIPPGDAETSQSQDHVGFALALAWK